MSSYRILIVEDDPTFRSVLGDNLLFEGFVVDAVGDGEAAIAHSRSSQPDLIILDLNLPDWDGLKLCPLLRRGREIPIVVLSSRGEKIDKLRALELGADDYVTKPMDLEELIARIRAVLRRSHKSVDKLTLGKIVVDFEGQRAISGRKVVRLSHHELRLLRYLAEHRDHIVPREDLLAEVWGHLDPNVTTRTVDQAIFRLRQKIEPDPSHPMFIRTAHWDGYMLSVPGPKAGRKGHA